MAELVAEVDQTYETPGDAVSVTFPPWQKVVAPEGVIVAAGGEFTVTVMGAEVAEQPFASLTVTV